MSDASPHEFAPDNAVMQTARLRLRPLSASDAAFILELVNDADWLRYIGDRGVHTMEDAERYILQGPVAMYEARGFGLYGVELLETGVLIGMCGLIKRDALEDVDIGFALLPAYRRGGYGREAAEATLSYARDVLGLPRVAAIVSPDNDASIGLLERIGLHCEGLIRLPDGTADVALYRTDDFAGFRSGAASTA
jgi:RimJ/RimL family protein N-acetyltransferase